MSRALPAIRLARAHPLAYGNSNVPKAFLCSVLPFTP